MHERYDKWSGRLLGMPYDLDRPTWARVKRRVWNAEDDRILVPEVFGWGWTVNLHALLRRAGSLRRRG